MQPSNVIQFPPRKGKAVTQPTGLVALTAAWAEWFGWQIRIEVAPHGGAKIIWSHPFVAFRLVFDA